MNDTNGCEYLLEEARDYLALLLSHDAIREDIDLVFAYELLDKLTSKIGEDDE